jgi:hypothetical protein
MGCICDLLCPYGAQGFDAGDASCGSAAAHDAHRTSDRRISVCVPIYLAFRDFIFSCKDLQVEVPASGTCFGRQYRNLLYAGLVPFLCTFFLRFVPLAGLRFSQMSQNRRD